MRPTANYIVLSFICSWVIILTCCSSNVADTENPTSIPSETDDAAAVIAVTANGTSGNYTFNVTIASPDTGCSQYADWWEVVDTNGTLIYRRILAHSHVNEQPFTRSGGTVSINPDTEVYIRAHMNTTGYGTKAFKGTVSAGFQAMELATDFAMDVVSQAPLPSGCAF